jgi:hypothetical protein
MFISFRDLKRKQTKTIKQQNQRRLKPAATVPPEPLFFCRGFPKRNKVLSIGFTPCEAHSSMGVISEATAERKEGVKPLLWELERATGLDRAPSLIISLLKGKLLAVSPQCSPSPLRKMNCSEGNKVSP